MPASNKERCDEADAVDETYKYNNYKKTLYVKHK
jgi:hypothetical protein